MDYEKKYWSQGEFKKSDGSAYVGYVGIKDGRGYVYDGGEELEKLDKYITQFNSSSKFFDRLLQETLQLPFRKRDVQFQANDFLYHGTIKQILEKLQTNNDYLFQQATISDTLIPAVDDCSVFATSDNSYRVFVASDGKKYRNMPESTDTDVYAQVKKSLEDAFVYNDNWDTDRDDDLAYDIKPGELPKSQYPKKYKRVPQTDMVIDLTEGVLKRYDFKTKTTTRTALDSTFYPQDGSTPKYDFNNIVNSDCCITRVGIDEDGDKRVKILLFVAFKTKFIIMRYIFYPDNFQKNTRDDSYDTIDFNSGSDVLVFDTIDPANKNTLNFLEISDIRVRGNYLYVVDSKLNMALRYDITYLKEEDGQIVWDVRSLRLLDTLQGDGTTKDKIYFNRPVSIEATDDNIFIADAGNNCIKVYSKSFDYVRTVKNGPFTSHDIQTVQINPYSITLDDGTEIGKNSLWVFSVAGESLYLTIVSNGLCVFSKRIQRIHLIKHKYEWDEKFKSVKFSFNNSNYYYICTTKRIYKLHLSKPNYPFASLSYFKQRILLSSMIWGKVPYPWHILPAGEGDDDTIVTWSYRPPQTSAEILDNKCFCLCGCDSIEPCDNNGTESQFDGDIIFHIGNLYNQSKIDTYCKRNNCTFNEIPANELKNMIKCSGIFLYNETSSYLSSMSKLNYPCFITEEINDMDPSEYVNPITFNKMMYKVIFNLINIKNTLLGRFWGYYNLDELMAFDQMEYDDYFQSLRIEKNNDFFIHDNEPTSIVVNRVFEKVWDLQQKLLNHMQTKYRAMGALTNNSFKSI